jgi:CBS domain-containing protein
MNTAQVRTAAESPAHAGDALVRMLETLRVRDLMDREWPYVVTPVTTLGDMVGSMKPGTRPVFAVVDGQHLRGVVSIPDILRAMDDPYMSDLVIASDLIGSRIAPLQPGQGLYDVLPAFGKEPLEALPVTAEGGRRFMGMLSRQAIHQAVRERTARMREHLHREHSGIATIEQDEQLFSLLSGVSAPSADTIQRMPVPPEVVGHAIRACDFRRRYGAQVIGIQNEGGQLQCPPNIDEPLKAGQLLLVILSAGPPDEPDAIEGEEAAT